MGYRWKPNKAQREAYKEKMQEKDSLPIIRAKGAIRNGCAVSFYSVNKGRVVDGIVVNHSYGATTNQHTFTILSDEYGKVLVKGRNLYSNLLSHVQGEDSLREG